MLTLWVIMARLGGGGGGGVAVITPALFVSDQGEAGAADGEEEGDDVQVGRQMGLAAAP